MEKFSPQFFSPPLQGSALPAAAVLRGSGAATGLLLFFFFILLLYFLLFLTCYSFLPLVFARSQRVLYSRDLSETMEKYKTEVCNAVSSLCETVAQRYNARICIANQCYH